MFDLGNIAPDKLFFGGFLTKNIFLISAQNHVMGTYWKCIGKALLMSTHNICTILYVSTHMFSCRIQKNVSCTSDKEILDFTLGQTFLSYPR